MVGFDFLESLLTIFGLSAIVVFILGKFRIPSIIGFLTAGILLGPYGLELIKNVHLVEILAEIGIILLLFTIGLEFSLKSLLSLKRTVFAGGLLQVLITGGMVFMLARFAGWNTNTSIILGGLVALSSTAIVLKLLFDRAEIDSPFGRACMGILVFQDFCVVLFMLFIPMLQSQDKDVIDVVWVFSKAIIFITAVIISSRWLVPKILHQIVHTRLRELFVISIIFICLGTAYLTYKLGFSLALGAFIAGLVISESEYSFQAISDILPFRDSFNGLFFISVGMLMDFNYFLTNINTVMVIITVIIIIKFLTSSLAILLTGINFRTSIHSALILSQVGEFSFVLAVAALRADIITADVYQLFLASAIITMILTPVFVALSPRISMWVASRRLLDRFQSISAHDKMPVMKECREDHVIIIGFGANGRNLSIVLKELKVPYIILEMNNQTVRKFRKEGEPIYYGDGTSREILHKLGIEKARVAVISITDPSATRNIVNTARSMNPGIFIAVRTRFIAEVEDLLSTGADEVIPAEFETSIELFSRVLHFYHMPKKLIGQYAEKFRKGHYEMFVRGEPPKRLFHDTVALMPEADYESYIIESGSRAINASFESLNIEGRTGAHIVAVSRQHKNISLLSTDFVFLQGDIILMIGDRESLEKAHKLFSENRRKI
jgi:CPA2 family monovalent cation:H+ antiporter-2